MIFDEVKSWSQHNFPNQTPENCLLGCIEELGELSHQILKTEQKIRKPSPEKIKDAISDFNVFLCHFCVLCDYDFNGMFNRSMSEERYTIDVPVTTLIFELLDSLNELIVTRSEDAVDEVLDNMNRICVKLGVIMEEELLITWNEVKKRDWIKYPTDGLKE